MHACARQKAVQFARVRGAACGAASASAPAQQDAWGGHLGALRHHRRRTRRAGGHPQVRLPRRGAAACARREPPAAAPEGCSKRPGVGRDAGEAQEERHVRGWDHTAAHAAAHGCDRCAHLQLGCACATLLRRADAVARACPPPLRPGTITSFGTASRVTRQAPSTVRAAPGQARAEEDRSKET